MVPADVLFPGLQGHTQGRLVLAVFGYTDDTAGYRTLESVPGCKKCRMRPAKTHRHAKALGVADGDVGTYLGRGLEQDQGEQVGGHHQEGPGGNIPFRQAYLPEAVQPSGGYIGQVQ